MHVLHCPRCNKELRFTDIRELPFFPFCSRRCRMIDLDQWFTEEHRISEVFPDLLDGGEQEDDS